MKILAGRKLLILKSKRDFLFVVFFQLLEVTNLRLNFILEIFQYKVQILCVKKWIRPEYFVFL